MTGYVDIVAKYIGAENIQVALMNTDLQANVVAFSY